MTQKLSTLAIALAAFLTGGMAVIGGHAVADQSASTKDGEVKCIQAVDHDNLTPEEYFNLYQGG